MPEEMKLRISKSLKNRIISPEHRQRISKSKMGHVRSESDKKKQSLNHADVSGKKNPRWRGYCHTPYGIFETTVEASIMLKISRLTILHWCNIKKDKKWYFRRRK